MLATELSCASIGSIIMRKEITRMSAWETVDMRLMGVVRSGINGENVVYVPRWIVCVFPGWRGGWMDT